MTASINVHLDYPGEGPAKVSIRKYDDFQTLSIASPEIEIAFLAFGRETLRAIYDALAPIVDEYFQQEDTRDEEPCDILGIN